MIQKPIQNTTLKFCIISATVTLCLTSCKTDEKLPNDFIYIHQKIPSIVLDIRYAGNDNFVGRPIVGYQKNVAILSAKATAALKNVQLELNQQGLGLKIFDAYRPQQAVSSFEIWAKDFADTLAKKTYYPDIDKKDLFTLGYIASKSGHTRGSTVDLTLIDLNTKQELDMGSPFDFFGTISHHNTDFISIEQKKNREILRVTMLKHGFKEYAEEWWHYTLIDEPFPETYFDFVVK